MNKHARLTVILALAGALAVANAGMVNQSFAYTASAEKTMLGHFTLIAKDEYGNIKDYQEVDNIITDEGDACIGNLAFSATGASCSGGVMDSLAVSDCDGAGTGDLTNGTCGAPAETTTQLDDVDNADIGDQCEAATSNYTAASGNNKVTLSATFNAADVDASGDVMEAGVLNGCLAGDQLFALKTFTTINITGSDTLTVNYEITFSG